MKNVILIVLALGFIGLIGCKGVNLNFEKNNSNKTALRSSTNEGNYLNMEDFRYPTEQLIFFYDENEVVNYMVRIQGGFMQVPGNVQGSTNGIKDDALIIHFSNGTCFSISLNENSLKSNCGQKLHPSIGYGYAPLEQFTIHIDDLLSHSDNIDAYLIDIISPFTGVEPQDTLEGDSPICISGGEGSTACTSGLTGCETECTKEYWACCNVTCKCYKRTEWDDDE